MWPSNADGMIEQLDLGLCNQLDHYLHDGVTKFPDELCKLTSVLFSPEVHHLSL